MFYDHRARSVHKRLQLPVFSRASSFVEILISRERIFHATLPPPPSLSRHSPFLSLPPSFLSPLARPPPTRCFELVRRRAAHTIAIGLRLHCYVLPCAPVYYYYRFSTLSFRDHKQVGVRRTMRRNNGRD